MDPVSIISLLSFGKDAIEVIDRIYELFQAVREAPKTLQRLLNELGVLRRILSSISDVCNQIYVAEEDLSISVRESCEQALGLVQNQVTRLYSELQKYDISKSTKRLRAWRASLNMVLEDKKINEWIDVLERGKSLLAIAQTGLQLHIAASQTRAIKESTQRTADSIKLSSAMASCCLMQAQVQGASTKYDLLNSKTPTSITLSGKPRCEDQSSFFTMRQEFAELKTAVSSLVARPLRLANFERQLLQPAVEEAVYSILQQEHSRTLQLTKQSGYFAMSPEGRRRDRMQLRNSPRLPNLAKHQQYSQNRFSEKDLIYLSSWLGKITVTRKTRLSQSIHRQEGELENDELSQTTVIQFTPAPWLTSTAYIISLQKELTYATSSHIGMALQPVRYRQIPEAAFIGIRHGDLALLQQMLAAGQLSLHDRDVGNRLSLSLLELSIDAINWVWLFNEAAVFTARQVHMRDIIRTARWFLARGTSADTQCQDVVLPTSFDFCYMRGSYSSDEIEQMEHLLIDISENELPIPRCQRLLSFALSNPEHSLYVDYVIFDIAKEDYTDEEILSVSDAEERYWAKGSVFDRGQESVIFHSLIRMRREFKRWHPEHVPETIVREILKGPRRLLFEMLKVALDISTLVGAERAQTVEDVIDYSSSLLRICRDLSILEDGFGDLLAAYAHEHHFRDIWSAVISNSTGYSDGIDQKLVQLDLDTSIAHFIRVDSESRVSELEASHTETDESPNTKPAFFTYVWALVILLIRSFI